jgi:hypothetical protein
MQNTLLVQARTLRDVIEGAAGNTHNDVGHSLNSLRDVALALIPPGDASTLEKVMPRLRMTSGPYGVNSDAALILCNQVLSILEEHYGVQIEDPEEYDGEDENEDGDASYEIKRVVPRTSKVFVIHGHDTTNTLRLRAMLKERFALAPVILSEQPARGRTIIEKFESEADDSSYAFALITPDDLIRHGAPTYAQARPNVLFELAWFYGRLGRDRVCILFQESTRMPSDLDGISRIQFRASIEEKVTEIENELRASNLIS